MAYTIHPHADTVEFKYDSPEYTCSVCSTKPLNSMNDCLYRYHQQFFCRKCYNEHLSAYEKLLPEDTLDKFMRMLARDYFTEKAGLNIINADLIYKRARADIVKCMHDQKNILNINYAYKLYDFGISTDCTPHYQTAAKDRLRFDSIDKKYGQVVIDFGKSLGICCGLPHDNLLYRVSYPKELTTPVVKKPAAKKRTTKK